MPIFGKNSSSNNQYCKDQHSTYTINVGVLESIILSHTPAEAMSFGLAKAGVPWKIYSVLEKLSFLIKNQREWEVYINFIKQEYGQESIFLLQQWEKVGKKMAN